MCPVGGCTGTGGGYRVDPDTVVDQIRDAYAAGDYLAVLDFTGEWIDQLDWGGCEIPEIFHSELACRAWVDAYRQVAWAVTQDVF